MMEEVILRFPHLGVQIFAQLEYSSLARCRETTETWQDFINNEKFYKKRIQNLMDDWQESYENELRSMSCDEGSLTPLHSAAMSGQTWMFFDQSYGYKNPTDDTGFTPLHFAAEKGFILICKLILEDIKDVDALFFQHTIGLETPFYLAATHGHIELCQWIIEKLFEKYPDDIERRETLLHLPEYSDKIALFEAASNGHVAVCNLILAHVEDKNPKDTNGDTFLHIASREGELNICKLIIRNITDKNPSNDEGETPLHIFAKLDYLEMCKLLIENIIDKNPSDQKGQTPLHLAATRGNVSICEYIIDIIDEKNPADKNGFTPLHHAAEKGHLSICQLIVDKVGDKNPKTTNEGFTPFDYAVAGHHQLIIDLLTCYTVSNYETVTVNSRFKKDLSLQMQLHNSFFSDDEF